MEGLNAQTGKNKADLHERKSVQTAKAGK